MNLADGEVERATGIEPAYRAWEASALPLSYARVRPTLAASGAGSRLGDRQAAIARAAWVG